MTKKVVLNATELTNVDVQYVSLVKRGANRIPFRIIKQESSEMIDLSKLFKREKAPENVVRAVLMAKSDFTEAAKSLLHEASLKTDAAVEDGDYVLLKQDGEMPECTSIVRINKHLALVVENPVFPVTKTDNWADLFTSQVRDAGFYPEPRIASSFVAQATEAVMATAKQEQEQALASVMKAHADYTQAYVKAVPAEFITLAVALADALEVAEKTEEPEAEVPAVEAPAAEVPVVEEPAVEEPAAEVPAAEEPVVEEPVAEVPAAEEPVAEPEEDRLVAVQKQIEALSQQLAGFNDLITSLNAVVETVKAETTALKGELEAVKTVAEKAETTLQETVVSAPPAGDPVWKMGLPREDALGCFDTAFQPQVRKGFRGRK